MEDDIDNLFFSEFNDDTIFKEVVKSDEELLIKEYEKYKQFSFSKRKDILAHPKRELIQSIHYNGKEMLEVGDLPVFGILKEIELHKGQLIPIKGDCIPFGVEVLIYNGYNGIPNAPLSTLPITIHTVKGIIMEKSQDNNNNQYYIPPNIKSISFSRICPNISNHGDNFLVIPNTIRELIFHYNWNNENIKLNEGDIPDGVTKLQLANYQIKSLSKGILPESIIDLEITCNEKEYEGTIDEYTNGLFDFIPSNIQTLSICETPSILKPISGLYQFTSIKKLTIESNDVIILPNSLPPSLTKLKAISFRRIFQCNVIPNSVTKLSLNYFGNPLIPNIPIGSIPPNVKKLKINRIIIQDGVLPQTLNSLILKPSLDYFDIPEQELKDSVIKMISILPKSLSYFRLNEMFKKFKFIFPPTINKIDYSIY